LEDRIDPPYQKNSLSSSVSGILARGEQQQRVKRLDDLSKGSRCNMSIKERPIHEVRFGSIKAAIWRNETDLGPRYGITFERLYRSDQGWSSTTSFGRDDLLLLAKVANEVHSFIHQQSDRSDPAPEHSEHPSSERPRQERQRAGSR
jgi:hypothetical protein